MVPSLTEAMQPNAKHAIACHLCDRYIAVKEKFIACTRANPSRVVPVCISCGHAARVCVSCQREVTPDAEHLMVFRPEKTRADGTRLGKRVHALCGNCVLDKGLPALAICWWAELGSRTFSGQSSPAGTL